VPESAKPLVGIVVVSHSARIAAGVVELARQMAGEDVRLIAAGGMADGSVGTDAVLIGDAIAAADAGAGVLVLADLGSAVLSTKLALTMIDPDLAGRTRLSGGPIVEGAIGAAVQARAGRRLDEVLREAEAAASMDKHVADDDGPDQLEPAGPTDRAGMFRAEVRNASGLHARPAAGFVRAASNFQSAIWLENETRGTERVDAKSPSAVLSSGVRQGHFIRVHAEGEDQNAALAALLSLTAGGFGEGTAAPPEAPPADGDLRAAATERRPLIAGAITGTPGAPGVAIGPVWRHIPRDPAVHGIPRTDERGDPATVIVAAGAEAAAQLDRLAARVRAHGRAEDAAIFEAQALLATDRKVLDDAIARAVAGQAPAAAVESAADGVAAKMAALDDELLAARAADFRDVGARIARIIRGESLVLPTEPSIAVAEDLPPSVAEEMPEDLLLGVAIQGGSATSHVVILARGRGIPAVVAVPALLAAAGDAAMIGLDGTTGEVVIDPDATQVAEFEARAEALAARRHAAAALRDRPAATADGQRVTLLANIGGPADVARALEMRAEGVGLFRTEFLFMKRQSPPSEAEQIEPYRQVFDAFGPDRPVVIRLADIGGDKAIPYLNLAVEANPFLGVRAIRLAGQYRELLSAQLRAIWRAAGRAGVTPHVMAPMVATIADVELLLELRDEARAAVAASGDPLPDRMITGVMIEIPSAAIQAAEIARLVDFFSIGTNDLTQYTLAADRSNAALAYLQDALHPAVLKLIAGVVAGAAESRVTVAVCGELAGDPAGALVLAGLGVTELSADAGSLDGLRAALSSVTRRQLDDLGRQALTAADASEVRAAARRLLDSRT
jgi:multiphosphoryl transfer protein